MLPVVKVVPTVTVAVAAALVMKSVWTQRVPTSITTTTTTTWVRIVAGSRGGKKGKSAPVATDEAMMQQLCHITLFGEDIGKICMPYHSNPFQLLPLLFRDYQQQRMHTDRLGLWASFRVIFEVEVEVSILASPYFSNFLILLNILDVYFTRIV